MTSPIRGLLALAAALVASHANATFHTFVVNEVYSNADGTVQYVELREALGFGGQGQLVGHSLTSTSTHTGVTKTFPFPNDLPSNTALKKVLIATQGFAALSVVAPDYVMPNGFLATDGATVNYAGVSSMTYGDAPLTPLPIDGVSALSSSGVVMNAPTNFAGAMATLVALPVTAVEFYRQAVDHYFISALQPDIDALDSGRLAGWARTGLSFKVFPTQAAGGAGANPVCRFYIPYATASRDAAARGKPLAELAGVTPENAEAVAKLVSASGKPVDTLVYLPLHTRTGQMAIVLGKADGAVIGVLSVALR